MFDMILYTNSSPTNYVNKDLSYKTYTVQGVLREGCSLIDPIFSIQASSPGFHTNEFNYLYVPEFGPNGRYYYITNIISVNETLWEIHCHVDVLMTYAEEIKAQSAIVARQESKYNLYLDDGVFMAYQNPKIQTKLFSVEGPFETQEFVLIVAGN